jgi:hypothetical protein
MHNGFLKNYATTGAAKILDKRREVVAIHRERFVFPIALIVRKVQQGGQDAFMGVLSPLQADPSVATVWLTAQGLIICLSRNFTDHMGWKHQVGTGVLFG